MFCLSIVKGSFESLKENNCVDTKVKHSLWSKPLEQDVCEVVVQDIIIQLEDDLRTIQLVDYPITKLEYGRGICPDTKSRGTTVNSRIHLALYYVLGE